MENYRREGKSLTEEVYELKRGFGEWKDVWQEACRQKVREQRADAHNLNRTGLTKEEFITMAKQTAKELFDENVNVLIVDDLLEELWKSNQEIEKTTSYQCPLCAAYTLSKNKSIFFCSCGFRLDTGTDNITWDHLTKAGQAVLAEHSDEGCLHQPRFEEKNNFLWCTCPHCGFSSIIV